MADDSEIILPGNGYQREETFPMTMKRNFEGARGEKIIYLFHSTSAGESEVTWYKDGKIIPKGSPFWTRLETEFQNG